MDTHTVSFWTNLLQDDTQNFKKWWDLESGSNGKLYLMVTNDNPPKPKIEWSNLSPGIGLTSPNGSSYALLNSTDWHHLVTVSEGGKKDRS